MCSKEKCPKLGGRAVESPDVDAVTTSRSGTGARFSNRAPVVDRSPAEPAIPSGADLFDEIAAVRLLVELGELDPERVLDGEVMVVDFSRRSRCLVVRDGANGWVLKQGTSSETFEAVRFEARIYWVFRDSTAAVPAPRLIHADPRRCLLVVEHVPGVPLRQGGAGGSEGERLAAAKTLGKVLAEVHAFDDVKMLPILPPPPILASFRPSLASLQYRSSASLELIGLLQDRQSLCDELEGLVRLWKPIAMTHNDVRSDNLLIDQTRGTINIIDWELAGLGDPYWDLAGPLAEQLVWWLDDGELWGVGAGAQRGDAARSLAPVHKFAFAFLRTYCSHRLANPVELPRLMRWCAARLVQSSFEIAYQHPILTATSQQIMQLAANMFSRPEHAARWLFGLEANDAN